MEVLQMDKLSTMCKNMGRYKIDTVIFNDLGNIDGGSHLPYIIGVVVVGPRGGKYLLDKFLMEQYLYACGCDYLGGQRIESLLVRLVIEGVFKRKRVTIIDGKTNEEIIQRAGEMLGYKTLSRKYGMQMISKWTCKI